MLPAPLWIPACSPHAHCPATVLFSLLIVRVERQSMGFGGFGCVHQKDSQEAAWTEWRSVSGGPCLQLPKEGGLARQVKKAGVSTGAFWPWQHSCWLCSTIVGHCSLSKSLLQKMPSQRGLLLLTEVRAPSSALLLFLFLFFSYSHICSLFSLVSNVSQHIMFSEVFKTDWEMLLEAVFYSTVCTLVYCQIKIKM